MIQKHPADLHGRNRAELSYLLLLTGTAALGGLLFGFDIAIITGAGPFLTQHFHLNDLSLGVAFSSLLFGCVIGSAFAGRMTDWLGRRSILLWMAGLFAVTSVLTGLAPTFGFFVTARFLGGLAVGGASLISPMYIAEIAPPSMRGRMGALYQLSIITGILLSYSINYLLRNAGPENWRWMFCTGVMPALLFFVLLLKAPETPRFLAMKNRDSEALSVLIRIAGRESAELEMKEIQASFTGKGHSWGALLRPGVRRAVLVGFCLAILVHVSGINTVIDYAPAIFQSAGWKIDAALFSTFIVGVVNAIFTLSSFWTIDRWGRKPLYIAGSLGMAAALAMLVILSTQGAFHGLAVIILLLIYLAFFASCVGPVFWTLVPEIFPNSIRGTAMTVPVFTQWVANATVVLLFPLAFNHLSKSITFGFLAAMSLSQGIFTWLFVPETKGETLERIEEFWKSGFKKENYPPEVTAPRG